MKNKLFILFCIVPFLVKSQVNQTVTDKSNIGGIQWTTGLNWEQVKSKAKLENKYIFLDLYATWCKPCKEMDKYVFTNDSVANYFNMKFISVKVQMDKTKKDNYEVKEWYRDAQKLERDYRVQAFPTYIFIAPDGKTTHIDKGYKPADKFLAIGELAVEPGRVYVDKYEEYDRLLFDYEQGVKNYDRMPYMIQSAKELREWELVTKLSKEYLTYLNRLKRRKLFTKDNIKFLGTSSINSSNKLFSVFFPDGKRADKTMGMKDYARGVADRIIFREIVTPFLKIREGGAMLGGVTDTTEADWSTLYNKLTEKYPKDYAERILLNAKIAWYDQHFNKPLLYKNYLDKLDKYGFDTTSNESNTRYAMVNFHCWFLFLSIDDRSIIERALKHMNAIVKARPKDFTYIDTYANLLYKNGQKAKAIEWEKQALKLVTDMHLSNYINNYAQILTKMYSGVPTWPSL